MPKASNLLAKPATPPQVAVPINSAMIAEGMERDRRWRTRMDQQRHDTMNAWQRKFWRIIDQAEAETGSTFAELFVVGHGRRGDVSAKRWQFWAVMRSHGLSFPEIAAATGSAHSAVQIGIRKLTEQATTDAGDAVIAPLNHRKP